MREAAPETLWAMKKEEEEIPLQSGAQAVVRKTVPLQPKEVQGEADTHLQYL